MRSLVISGSPRVNGNTAAMAAAFSRGAADAGMVETFDAVTADIRPCRGCLRCNLIKRCAINGDAWDGLSQSIQEADAVVFATPIYFHHVSAPMKAVLDRFRSFVHVRITETGTEYSPHAPWKKRIILLAAMGSSDRADAAPVIDLLSFMTRMLGEGNSFTSVCATRLAVNRQIMMGAQELTQLYRKLGLPSALAADDAAKNAAALERCCRLGKGAEE